MAVEQQGRAKAPVMTKFKQEFRSHRVGGEYNPTQQIRTVRTKDGTVPYVETKDMNGMASTHTGERSREH